MSVTIKGSAALERKLKKFPTEGKKAVRYGLAQGARLTVWFFKSAAPKFTGTTIKAIGNVERKVGDGYEQFVGVRQDYKQTKLLFMRDAKDSSGKVYEEYSLRKNKRKGFVLADVITKQPILYAGIVHDKNPWMKETWNAIRRRVTQTTIMKADERISKLLSMKG